ncbi:vitamin K-dependent protein S-like [Cucumis melo var. makuwa]|uniref:Vitamin K-dependent protein S-like n=1 Tax=Cucumis melo var. makuwa TaxID=1194695 RepID=A0A5A7UQQ7_CUCMM|nr:vitamin K-dependent protein S-like [Cucumis melo var. makuwa]
MAISLFCDRWRVMASIVVALALLLVFQSAKADDFNDLLSPLLSPIFENVCKEVNCGKGTCKTSGNGSFSFECDCESGWKQTLFDDDDDDRNHFKFLPCIIPKCNLTHSCSSAPPPGVQTKPRINGTILDPCSWVDCGGGLCNKTSPLTYKCNCLEGYYNLLNITAFPCYKDCKLTSSAFRILMLLIAYSDLSASRLFLKRGSLSTISSVVMYIATLLLLIK